MRTNGERWTTNLRIKPYCTATFVMDSGELKVDVPLASMESDVDEDTEVTATGSR